MAGKEIGSDSIREIAKSLAGIQDQMNRVGKAQIALTQGLAETTIRGTQVAIDTSSKTFLSGLRHGVECWSNFMKGGLKEVNNGMSGIFKVYTTSLEKMNVTLKEVSDILDGKKT